MSTIESRDPLFDTGFETEASPDHFMSEQSASVPYEYTHYELFEMLNDAFAEAITIPPPNKTLTGPFKDNIEQILKDIDEELEESGLTPDMLQYEAYQSTETIERISELSKEKEDIKDRLKYKKCNKLWRYGTEAVAPVLASQSSPSITFDRPPYVRQEQQRDCSAASFCMLFNGLTGLNLFPDAVAHIARVNQVISRIDEPLDEDLLMRMFQSSRFEKQFDIKVKNIPLYGADLRQIADVAQKVKERMPDTKTYCHLRLGKMGNYSVNHNAILLDSSQMGVTLLDPSVLNGPYYRIEHRKFAGLWARAYMRGNLIIGLPTQ